MGLEIQVGLRALPMEEHMVPRQPPHPQRPYEVSLIFVVMVYLLSTKDGSCSISNSIRIEQEITRTQPISTRLIKIKLEFKKIDGSNTNKIITP